MTTKLIHPYFGALDTCAVEGVSEDDSYDVLWEQEIPYKIVLSGYLSGFPKETTS